VRITSIVRAGRRLVPDMARRANIVTADAKSLEILEQHLKDRRCKVNAFGNARVYSRNLPGRYGSFITHLSILLVIVFGAAGLYLPDVTDQYCMPGQSVTMPDGTEIAVHSFYIENESGQLDFTSDISIILADGESRDGSIRVNYPLSHGPYKVYQQNYGTAGRVDVTNHANGGTDSFVMTEPAFLSADGVNGLWYLTVYPDYYANPDGSLSPVQQVYGRYENPLYYVQLSDNGLQNPQLILPGESLRLGDLEYRMESPVEYPGLRIKYTPPVVNILLFLSFALMIVGLYITFFMPPILVKVDENGYVAGGPKPEGTLLELKELLEEYEKGIDR